jgi:hypothetical protein
MPVRRSYAPRRTVKRTYAISTGGAGMYQCAKDQAVFAEFNASLTHIAYTKIMCLKQERSIKLKSLNKEAGRVSSSQVDC